MSEALKPRLGTKALGAELTVLVLYGSFCPIHNSHLAVLAAARDALVTANHNILGVLAPVPQPALVKKLGVGAPLTLDLSQRAALCQAACTAESGFNWVYVLPDASMSAALARDTVELELRHQHPGYNWRVLEVHGSDHARTLATNIEADPTLSSRVVCVNTCTREGIPSELLQVLREHAVMVVPSPAGDSHHSAVSSTRVRELAAAGKWADIETEQLLPPPVFKALTSIIADASTQLVPLLAAAAAQAEPLLTRLLTTAATAAGGALQMLEHRLKTKASLQDMVNRLAEKEQQHLRSVGEAQSSIEACAARVYAHNTSGGELRSRRERVPDALRYTVLFAEEGYTAGVTALRQHLVAAGLLSVRQSNFWVGRQQFRAVIDIYEEVVPHESLPCASLLFEVQSHTPSSLAHQTSAHELYKCYRSCSDPEAAGALHEQLCNATAAVKIPDGIHDSPETLTEDDDAFVLRQLATTCTEAHKKSAGGMASVVGSAATVLPSLPDLGLLSQRDAPERAAIAGRTCGPTPTSNWLVPGVVLAGTALLDEESVRAVSEAGVTTIVCLQLLEEQSHHVDAWLKKRCPGIQMDKLSILNGQTVGDSLVARLVLRLKRRIERGEVSMGR